VKELQKFWEVKELQKFWDGLPKELKVSVYLLVAYIISDLAVPFLGGIDSRVALVASNLLLVIAVELKKRFS